MIAGARLGLDIRATQNPRYAERGIGRYVAQLATALERVAPGAVDAFLLDGRPDAPAPSPVAGALPRLLPDRAVDGVGWRDVPTIFHATSPFEDGRLDEVWRRSLRRRDAALVVTAYDVIPLVFPDRYLSDPYTHRQYMNRCNLLMAADVVLAISEATGHDVVERLLIPESRVVVIGGGVDDWFSPGEDGPAGALVRLAGSVPGLTPGFIMYTGGIDYRKNVDGAIDGYALLDPGLRAAHQLVITCSVTDDERAQLLKRAQERGVADRLVITGYVSDEVLRDLYRACGVFVFPSIYEGFGLPIAEARACGAPVIAGDNSSLRELVPDPRARFDATDPRAVAARLADVLSDPAFEAQLRDDARRQDLSWDRVATKTLAGYEQAASVIAGRRREDVRPRLAIVTPWPPQLSGIADYAHMLVEHLARDYDVDVVVDGDPAAFAPPDAPRCRLTPLAGFDIASGWRRYDRIIYQLGNSEFHARALDMLSRVPGEVIAHDVRLTGLYWWRGHHTSGPPIADELDRIYGAALPDELRGAPHVTGDDAERLGIWMMRDVIAHATRIWVHSDFARGVVCEEAAAADLPCRVDLLPFGHPAPGAIYPSDLPLAVRPEPPSDTGGLPPPGSSATRIVTFGVLGPTKGNEVLVDATPAIIDAVPDAYVVFVGPVSEEWRESLAARADALGVGRRVGFTGALAPSDYEQWIRDADVAVQLRRTTNGESSGTVADALANSLPTVLTRLGWFAEIPATAVEGVSPGAGPSEVATAVIRVLTDRRRRDEMVRAGVARAVANGFDQTAATLHSAGAALPAG